MRIAWDWLVGFRPPIARITSPPLSGRVESAGAFTTRIPSFVPKYSPRSGFRLTSSRSPQGSPNDHSKTIPGMCGIATMGPGISIRMAPSRSSATRVACFVSDPRRYSIRTVSPGSSLWARVTSLRPGPDSSSSSALMPPSDVPANLVMMSPTLRPAFSAGLPGVTPSILAPTLSLSALASVRTTTPIRPRLSLNENENARAARGARGARGVAGGSWPASPAAHNPATAGPTSIPRTGCAAGAAPPAPHRARPASGRARGVVQAAPCAARCADTAHRAPPGTPRTPRRASAPSRKPRPPAGPADHPSCNASSCRSFIIQHAPQARVRPRQLRLGETHRLAHLLRDLLVCIPFDVVQPHHRARRLAQPLERALQVDPRRDRRAPPSRSGGRFFVQLLRCPHLVAPDPHEGLGRSDLSDPSPQVSFAAVLLEAPHHLDERLLQHILGVLRAAQYPEGDVVHGRFEGPIQRLQRLQVARLCPGDQNVGDGERDGHLLKT